MGTDHALTGPAIGKRAEWRSRMLSSAGEEGNPLAEELPRASGARWQGGDRVFSDGHAARRRKYPSDTPGRSRRCRAGPAAPRARTPPTARAGRIANRPRASPPSPDEAGGQAADRHDSHRQATDGDAAFGQAADCPIPPVADVRDGRQCRAPAREAHPSRDRETEGGCRRTGKGRTSVAARSLAGASGVPSCAIGSLRWLTAPGLVPCTIGPRARRWPPERGDVHGGFVGGVEG